MELEIEILQDVLEVALPEAYVALLEQEDMPWTDDGPLLGLPLTEGLDSPWGATEAVWAMRPEFQQQVVALQISGLDAICLEVGPNAFPDPAVKRISLNTSEAAEQLAPSLTSFLDSLRGQGASEEALHGQSVDVIDAFAASLALQFPKELISLLTNPRWYLEDIVYALTQSPHRPPDIRWAQKMMVQGESPPSAHLVPISAVDDKSFACVVCAAVGDSPGADFGSVVRWHLDSIPPRFQAQLLDTGVANFIATMEAELQFRSEGIRRMTELAAEFHESHGKDGTQPKVHVERPVRLAVQNVILGLASIRHDSSLDALRSRAWQNCQAPHVAAHEGNRGLALMTLTEAFRAGGTMEIRFDGHPENAVPASLRQYGRTVGVELGETDPRAITPEEARRLFIAASRLPKDLAGRVDRFVQEGKLSPERVCFMIAAGIWRPIELDFLLATTPHATSILKGGVAVIDRRGRQAELSAAVSARVLGMLHQRLSNTNNDGSALTPVVEDDRGFVGWEMLGHGEAVRLSEIPIRSLPWLTTRPVELTESVVVVPRAMSSWPDADQLQRTLDERGEQWMVVVPRDEVDTIPRQVRDKWNIAVCPDPVDELVRQVDERLVSAKVGRM